MKPAGRLNGWKRVGLEPRPRRSGALDGTRSDDGFTLIELLVVVALATILIMVAAPNLADMATSARLNTVSDRWIASASLARSEALKRNRPVTLCPTTDDDECATTGGAQVWGSGWLIGYTVGTTWTVVEREGPVPGGYRLEVKTGTDPAYAVVFEPSGLNSSSHTAVVCRSTPSGNLQQRTIDLSITGRAQLSKAPRTTACPT